MKRMRVQACLYTLLFIFFIKIIEITHIGKILHIINV